MGGPSDEIRARRAEHRRPDRNEDMAREGQAEATEAKARREAEGAVDKGVGKVTGELGRDTGDEEFGAKGKARQVEGDIKSAGEDQLRTPARFPPRAPTAVRASGSPSSTRR